MAIFCVTILPFNFLHHHNIDEHHIAVASHQRNHTCEIDKNFCKDENATICGHEHHLNTSLVKCFFCQFHFEKNYDAVTFYSTPIISLKFKMFVSEQIEGPTSFVKLISNKGPPELI
jgi:hypothetical protein